MLRRFSSFLVCGLALGLAAGALRAVPESLLRNSPFLPAGNVPAVGSPQSGRIELRGIVKLGESPRFALVDTSTNRAAWLAVGESDNGLKVVAYDAAAEAVTIELEGQSARLTLKEAQIVNIAVPLPTAPGVAAGNAGAANVNAAPPANEQEIQERRNRIIEELRRRRALRQAGQAQPPPNNPSP